MPYGLDTVESASSLPLTPPASTSTTKGKKSEGLIDLAQSVIDGKGGPGAVFKMALLSRYAPGLANAATEEAFGRDPNSAVAKDREARALDLQIKQHQSDFEDQSRKHLIEAYDQLSAGQPPDETSNILFKAAVGSGDVRGASAILTDKVTRQQQAEEDKFKREQFDYKKVSDKLDYSLESSRIAIAKKAANTDIARLTLDRDKAALDYTATLFHEGIPYDIASALTAEKVSGAAYNKPVHQEVQQLMLLKDDLRNAKTIVEQQRAKNAIYDVTTRLIKESSTLYGVKNANKLKEALAESLANEFGISLKAGTPSLYESITPGRGTSPITAPKAGRTDPNADKELPDDLKGF